MVMIVLANAMLDKFGGDTIADTRDSLERYQERLAAPIEAPVAGGRRSAATGDVATADTAAAEVGSGGDD
jgi:hypothetical protein